MHIAEIRYDVTGKYETYYDLYLTVDKRDKSGAPLRIIGTLRDITDNKLNEKKLIEANRDMEEAPGNKPVDSESYQ